MFAHPPLKQVHQSVAKLLDQTDELFRSGFTGKLDIHQKNGTHQAARIVTQIDGQIENLIKRELQQRYPEIGFIGEETEAVDGGKLNWVIDPLDGTYNFARRFPVCATSISLWHADRPIYAQVSLPLQYQRIASWIGGGVLLADQPVVAWQRPEQTTAVVSQFGSSHEKLQVLSALTALGWETESWGSAVYAAGAMAHGSVSLNVDLRVSTWDLAANWLFAQELGLQTKFLGQPPNLAVDNLKEHRYSLIMGPMELVESAANCIQRLPSGVWHG